MFKRKFWIETGERAAKSAAQYGLLSWGTAVFTSVGEVVSTAQALGFGLLFGAGISILTSIGSAPFGEKDTPSLVKE
jgi:hypothetical protein